MDKEQTSIELIQSLYAAFGRGDVPFILEACSDDIVWTQVGPEGFAYAGTCKGKAQVAQWFGHVAVLDNIKQFEPREFFSGPDHCTVVGWQRTADSKTGKEFSTDWIHHFLLKQGKVIRWIGAFDSDARARAARV
jgi:uncharacterized protein